MVEGVNARVTRVAAVHASPVLLDLDATLEVVRTWVSLAAEGGAELVVFGESFIPGFPLWNMLYAPIDQHKFYRRLFQNAVTVPGPTVMRLAEFARSKGIFLAIGVTEKSQVSTGSMWNSNLIFDRNGKLISHRRKLIATWAEKLSWGHGDACHLEVVATEIGRLGALICGENFNALARYVLVAQGEQIHLATYPPAWPVARPADGEVSCGYDIGKAIHIRAAAHSLESKAFSVVAACHLDENTVDVVADGDESIAEVLRRSPQGASMIVGPGGECVGAPLTGKEGIVLADLDLGEIVAHKELHDLAGHYNRFDIFSLSVNKARPQPIDFRQPDRATGRAAEARPETPESEADALETSGAIP